MPQNVCLFVYMHELSMPYSSCRIGLVVTTAAEVFEHCGAILILIVNNQFWVRFQYHIRVCSSHWHLNSFVLLILYQIGTCIGK